MNRFGHMISKNALLGALLCYLSIVAVGTACTQKEPDIPTPKLIFTDKVEADFQSVTLSCAVSGNVTAEKLFIEYAKDQALTGALKKPFEKKGDGFVITLSGLEIQTTYYYRYSVENKASSFTDEKIRLFKTSDYVVPVVLTGDSKSITGTKATIEGSVEFACGKEIIEQGFFVGTDTQNLQAKPVSVNEFSLSLDNLSFETTYYYQAYAKSEIGIGKGEIKSFKTSKAVTFNAIVVEEIAATSVVAKGGVADNGGIEIEKQGFRYCEATSAEYTFEECSGERKISGLKPATLYEIWYYAKTFEGEFESEKVEFETKDGIVLITTSTPDNISTTSATLKANISSDGGSAITERGFCYGKNENPSLTDTIIKVAGTTGAYQYNLTNLPQNSKYFVRAYAINAIGTYYGESVAFTTSYDSVTFGTTSCSNVTATSASFAGSITYNGGSTITRCGFCYSTSSLPTVDDMVVEVTGSQTTLAASVKSLYSGMTYHVRAFATNANSTFYSNEITFVTQDGVVQFSNPAVSNILAASATLTSSIISAGGGTISERGFCYGQSKSPTTSGLSVKAAGISGEFSCPISGLANNSVYYVRAYAINETGTFYSEEASFTTLSGIASVTTLSPTNVKALSATVNGEVISDGGSTISERGFCYSSSPNPTTNNNPVKISGTIGTITKDLTNLIKGTKYYVRAYAINSYGTHYGNEISFTTSDGNACFNELSSSDVTVSSFKVSTNITSDGDNTITKRGFRYSTSPAPTVSNQTITVSGTTGAMSGTVSGLTNNTKYFVRAFATNETGTSYSSEIAVSTLSGLAEVETTALNSITAQSVEVSGNVVSANGGTITARGFCYGTNESPTIADSKVGVSGTTGTMSKTISGLTINTKYFIRAYATTTFGTSYGAVLSFTTENGAIAFSVISTSDIKATTASISVSINSNGGSPITERGFCIATTEMPTTSNTKVQVSSSSDSYSTSLTSLARSTTYYVRAYAKNEVGTHYSNQTSFSTLSGLASFSTLSTTNVAQTTIGLTCGVTSNGGADISQRGFCYSTSSSPTIDSNKIIVNGTTGEMAGTLSGLTSNQQYYIRAFAKTQYGMSYSDEISVKTDAGLVTFDGMSVNNIEPQSAKFNSTIASIGGADITSLGFCYGKHANVTTSDMTIAAESSVMQFWANAASLEQNTVYYVKPYAINQYGTSYGEEVSFKTTYYTVDFSTINVSEVMMKSATLYCTVTTDSRNSIKEMGICINSVTNPTVTNNLQKIVSATKNMSIRVSSLESATMYFARPYLINSVGEFYGPEVSFTTSSYPDGAAPGLFSVSSDTHVYLAKGNLTYYQTTNEWYFAEEQYSFDYDAITTFPWGGSGYGYASPISGYAPYDASSESNRVTSLKGTGYDWGQHCAIVNGGNEAGLWMTLSQEEWHYLLTERTNANDLKRFITINGKTGLLLLPDDWVAPATIDMTSSSFTVSQWKQMENNGAVFLKEEKFVYKDGTRYDGNSVEDTPYWTSSCASLYFSGGYYLYYPQYFTFVSVTDSSGYSTGSYAHRLFYDHLLFEAMKGGVHCYVRLGKYYEP